MEDPLPLGVMIDFHLKLLSLSKPHTHAHDHANNNMLLERRIHTHTTQTTLFQKHKILEVLLKEGAYTNFILHYFIMRLFKIL